MHCIICDKEAQWFVRGTSNAYCEEHAKEFFSDTSYLASVEEDAQRLFDVVEANRSERGDDDSSED